MGTGGVVSLEMVNRIIKRAPVLPRRQKLLMISLIFVAQCNTEHWEHVLLVPGTLQQAFYHTQLWPCEIPCNLTVNVEEKQGGKKRERTCYRRLPDVPSIP